MLSVSSEYVLVDRPRPHVALVTLNRPERMNSMAFDVMLPLRDVLDELTDAHEATQAHPWKPSDAPSDYLDRLLQAIVGIEIRIDRMIGKAKLSQNRTPDDVRGVIGGLHEAGADALGLDWTTDIGEARRRVGHKVALQGNFDPTALFAHPAAIAREAERILDSFGPHPGHVFNLGHGISQHTPPEHVSALVEAVHRHSRAIRAGTRG